MPLTSEDRSLVAAFEAARVDYATNWKVVDQELYELCDRRPGHHNFADVYAKVVIVGRVYAAGIVRSSEATGDREAKVAEGIVMRADLINEGLAALAGKQFDRATAAAIIGLHGRITRDLCPYTGDKLLQSFVSKYLHFHCALVPIYDSRASEHIGRFIKRRCADVVRKQIAHSPDRLIAYRNFATSFLALTERLQHATGTRPGVKEIDHLLWRE